MHDLAQSVGCHKKGMLYHNAQDKQARAWERERLSAVYEVSKAIQIDRRRVNHTTETQYHIQSSLIPSSPLVTYISTPSLITASLGCINPPNPLPCFSLSNTSTTPFP
jgi:hypothetical protein